MHIFLTLLVPVFGVRKGVKLDSHTKSEYCNIQYVENPSKNRMQIRMHTRMLRKGGSIKSLNQLKAWVTTYVNLHTGFRRVSARFDRVYVDTSKRLQFRHNKQCGCPVGRCCGKNWSAIFMALPRKVVIPSSHNKDSISLTMSYETFIIQQI